jgi:pimeloyl-ACP methyl ester carboxylesterase
MTKTNLLFLPGLLEDADTFTQVIGGLREHADCVVADLTRSATIAGMADDALERAGEGSFGLVGHSMGGYVALEIMRRAPERVERLALINTNARPDSAEATANRRRLMALAQRDFPAVNAAQLPLKLHPSQLQNTEITGTIGTMALSVGKEAYLRQQEAVIRRVDSRPVLKQIRCPTLVIAGRQDQIMPLEVVKELADGIPGAVLTVIEDCGHMATLEHPATVIAALQQWLERKTT